LLEQKYDQVKSYERELWKWEKGEWNFKEKRDLNLENMRWIQGTMEKM